MLTSPRAWPPGATGLQLRSAWKACALSLALLGCASSPTPAPPGDAGAADAPHEASACESCGESVNASVDPLGGTVGNSWLAWEYKPSCSFTAAILEARSTSPVLALYADDGGKPGAALVASVATHVVRTDWVQAAIPPTPLVAGTSYWIAVHGNGFVTPTDGIVSPIGKSGTASHYTGYGPGNWDVPQFSAPFIFGALAGTCTP